MLDFERAAGVNSSFPPGVRTAEGTTPMKYLPAAFPQIIFFRIVERLGQRRVGEEWAIAFTLDFD